MDSTGVTVGNEVRVRWGLVALVMLPAVLVWIAVVYCLQGCCAPKRFIDGNRTAAVSEATGEVIESDMPKLEGDPGQGGN